MTGIFQTGEFLKHMEELRYRVIRMLAAFMVASIFFLIFRLNTVTFNGYAFPMIYPDPYANMGAQFLAMIESHVLPSGTQLLIVRPTDGLMADFYSCMFLGLSTSMPVVIYQLWLFIRPALRTVEVKVLRQVVIPGTALFIAGAFFGVWFVAPQIFRIFNQFDVGLGAVSSVSLMNFVSFILMYVVIFGISFEVPVFMVALTTAGVVSAKLWRDNWRYAVVGSFVFGMIFSPGVTGFTMIVMAIPMILLYSAGIIVTERMEARKVVEPELSAD